jgi:addiction module HigA family antidote
MEGKVTMTNPLLGGLRPVHPGEILAKDVLPALGRSKVEIAHLLGISRQTLYDILSARQAVTVPIAYRIGKLTGTTPESWSRMQLAYDLKTQAPAPEVLEEIPTLQAAA